MAWDEDIKILLAEEQTLLSRERTMHPYRQTGLAFTSVGLVIMKFLLGIFYACAGLFFIIVGAFLIMEAGKRYLRFRRAIAQLREKEARLGYDIGAIKWSHPDSHPSPFPLMTGHASCPWP